MSLARRGVVIRMADTSGDEEGAKGKREEWEEDEEGDEGDEGASEEGDENQDASKKAKRSEEGEEGEEGWGDDEARDKAGGEEGEGGQEAPPKKKSHKKQVKPVVAGAPPAEVVESPPAWKGSKKGKGAGEVKASQGPETHGGGEAGGARNRRERKQTEFYNPVEVSDPAPCLFQQGVRTCGHVGASSDLSPRASSDGRIHAHTDRQIDSLP